MNIAFFLGSYPGIGGTETVTNMLAECLVESGGGTERQRYRMETW